jgi:3-oxoacyl-[acyl-carrier protein] reductase/(S)-1-phenylethanol dehydrogenase
MSTAPVAIVTGAADVGGIGAACARALARAGHAVGVLDRRPCDELARELTETGHTVAGGTVDLADHAAIGPAVDALERELGDSTSVLVNCAADLTMVALAEIDAATMQRVLAVNVVAAAMLSRHVVPGMAERGFGRIVNVASDTLDRPPGAGFVPYVTAKGALIGLTRALAVELGPMGITVNAISPGLTSTPAVRAQQPDAAFQQVVGAQAIKRTLEPSDYEGILALLVSPAGEAITGQNIRADAGLVMA